MLRLNFLYLIKFLHLASLLHTAWKVSVFGVSLVHNFPAFGLNTERYFVYFHIQSEYEKIWTRITTNTDTFYAVGFPGFYQFLMKKKESAVEIEILFYSPFLFFLCISAIFNYKKTNLLGICIFKLNLVNHAKSWNLRKYTRMTLSNVVLLSHNLLALT